MPAFVDVSGTWRHLIPYVNISGAWRQIPQIYINVNNTWRPLWTYSWSIGGWGTCSATCGGGTQTRTVTCIRSGDNKISPDTFCTSQGAGTKPPTSQPCNTQSCVQVYPADGIACCGTSGGVLIPDCVGAQGGLCSISTGWWVGNYYNATNTKDPCWYHSARINGQILCQVVAHSTNTSCTANGKTYEKGPENTSIYCNGFIMEDGNTGSGYTVKRYPYDLVVK